MWIVSGYGENREEDKKNLKGRKLLSFFFEKTQECNDIYRKSRKIVPGVKSGTTTSNNISRNFILANIILQQQEVRIQGRRKGTSESTREYPNCLWDWL